MRHQFGGSLTDFGIEAPSAHDGDVIALQNAAGTFWDAATAGTQYTDLLDSDGATPRTDVETDSDGFLRVFYGPDGIQEGFLDFGAGRRFHIVSLQGVLSELNGFDSRYLGFVDVSTGLEPRPDGLARVIWIGGMSQPVNMAAGDVWLSEVVGGS